MRTLAIASILAVTAAACAAVAPAGPRAFATLEPRSGSQATGTVAFSERGGRVVAHVEMSGLAPGSVHGFHVHEKGDCSAPDASTTGSHFNPTHSAHGRAGGAVHHVGDLPSLAADAAGKVRVDLELADVTLGPGPNSIVGRSVVVHRDADDFTSQPAGNSGPKIACGVIAAR